MEVPKDKYLRWPFPDPDSIQLAILARAEPEGEHSPLGCAGSVIGTHAAYVDLWACFAFYPPQG